ncbi:methyl-accepting chemotaxis protein [Herbaspirillum sp. LeCh32-8]|nr:methyl-accepting chemotaxis protein [Herbaspirillum sp. LeCh32-8]
MILFLVFMAVLYAATLWGVEQMLRAQHQLSATYQSRHQSFLLADELRNSSTMLTQAARTYVVTGDSAFEKQYWDVLAIRQGNKPRPQHYERIYWDFVAAGLPKPSPDGPAVPLLELMKQAGFSRQELAKLSEAQDKSDALVDTERIAMHALRGEFYDSRGGFTFKGPPDAAMARTLMFGPRYYQDVAAIMKPINEFLVLLDHRTGRTVAEAEDASRAAHRNAIALVAVSFVASALVLWLIYRHLIRQLGGEPAQAKEIVRRIAGGDLALDIPLRRGDRASLLGAMRQMRERLAGVIGHVSEGAQMLARASGTVSAAAQSLSSATSEQAATIEETSTAVSRMASSISANHQNALKTDDIAGRAAQEAGTGEQVVGEAIATMHQIGQKIAMIDDIAYRTNLLALNAAIEASHSGVHGRGFGVVAVEVRKLAERCRQAAQDIEAATAGCVAQADRISELLGDVIPGIRQTSALVRGISSASEDQALGAREIDAAMLQQSQATQINAASSEELAATSEEMKRQADRLLEAIAYFRLDPDQEGSAQRQAPSSGYENADTCLESRPTD